MKVQWYMMIQGRTTLEVIKAKVGLHICPRDVSMDRKNRNKFTAMLRIHTEGLLTKLMITEMKKKIMEWRVIL